MTILNKNTALSCLHHNLSLSLSNSGFLFIYFFNFFNRRGSHYAFNARYNRKIGEYQLCMDFWYWNMCACVSECIRKRWSRKKRKNEKKFNCFEPCADCVLNWIRFCRLSMPQCTLSIPNWCYIVFEFS